MTLMNLSNIFSKRNKVLLYELVVTDFKLRYQNSALGYAWSLLKPLFLFAIMYVVFVHFLRFGEGIQHFAPMLLLGLVLWGFFTEATKQGMNSITSRSNLLRKINFPKYILVISATISAFINLLLNLIIVFIFMLIDGVDFGWTVLLFPLTLILLYGFSLALAFLFAALSVKYRDISYIWDVIIQAMFYGTPIFYPLEKVIDFSVQAAQLLMLNPVAVIIQGARALLVGGEHVVTAGELFSNPIYLAIPYVIILTAAVLAVWYFRKKQASFAEDA
jgi:ABC-2 type transport system permease protein